MLIGYFMSLELLKLGQKFKNLDQTSNILFAYIFICSM